MRTLFLVVPLVLATSVGLACDSDPFRPGAARRFQLVTVDGQVLPAVVFQSDGVSDITEWVVDGALTLGPGTAARLVVDDSTDSPLEPQPSPPDSLAGTFEVGGSRILVHYAASRRNAAYTDTGTVAGDSLRIETHYPIGMSGTISTKQFIYVLR